MASSGSATSPASRSSSRPTAATSRPASDLLEELGAISTDPGPQRHETSVRTGEAHDVPSGRAPHEGRAAPGPAADRPAAGPDDPRGRAPRLPARRPRHRRRAVHPGPARAARGAAGAGRPAARPLHSTSPATSSPGSTSGATSRSSSASCPRSAFRRMCKREYLNYLRIREWQDYESQLRQVGKEMKLDVGPPVGHPPTRTAIHQALLAGPALRTSARSRSATRRSRERRPMREYLGARGARFAIFPGSVLQGAATRLPDGRRAGRDLPAVGPAERRHQARVGRAASARTWSSGPTREPHWSTQARRGDGPRAGHALRRPARRRPPRAATAGSTRALARELFIRHALVQREWRHPAPLPRREQPRLLEEAEELEHRARRRDIVVDEETLFDFYDARVGADVVSGRTSTSGGSGAAADARPAHLRPRDAHPRHGRGGARRRLPRPSGTTATRRADLPDQLPLRARRRRRRPHHRRPRRHPQPGRGRRLLLARARAARGAGHRADPLAAQEPAGRVRAGAQHGRASSSTARRRGRSRCSTPWSAGSLEAPGLVVPREAWDWSKVPAHLRPTYRVVTTKGAEQARGKDLDALKAPLRPHLRAGDGGRRRPTRA